MIEEVRSPFLGIFSWFMSVTMGDSPPLLLLDLNGYIFRAWHALPPLSTQSGFPTQVIYGVAQMLLKLRSDYPQSPLYAIMDAPGKTWREEEFSPYKAQRPPAPEDLRRQIPPVLELVEMMGVPVISLPGYEADDLIAALARLEKEKDRHVLIISGDKDLLQLVNDRIQVLDPMRGEYYDARKVEEKWGVPPQLLPDLLTLVGDAVDGIPGVSGIGKKRACEILKDRLPLTHLLNHPEAIPASYRQRILADKDKIEKGLKLITLPHPHEIPNLPKLPSSLPPPQWEKVRHFFLQYEFHSLLKRLPESSREKEFLKGKRIRVVTRVEEILSLLMHPQLILDTETTSLDPHQADLVGISLEYKPDEAFYIPLRHREGTNAVWEEIYPALKAWAGSSDHKKIGHNLKYDYNVLRRAGIELKGIAGDTMIASYLLDPDAPTGHSLEEVAERLLRHRSIRYKDLVKSGDFSEVPIAEAAQYSCEDVLLTYALHDYFSRRLEEEGLWELYTKVELPLIPILADMEWWGIRVNPQKLMRLKKELEARMERVSREIFALVGHPFNLQSPRQVEAILFDELKLSPRGVRRTKTGARTTRAEVLERLKGAHPVVEKILEHRGYAKLIQTYIEALLSALSPKTNRVHPQFHQTVAATGRLISRDPNLQNIPIRDEWGLHLRDAFEAEDGFILIGADYSQLELRIMAHLSGEPALCRAFAEREDLHSRTASELFQIPLHTVTPELRRQAKTINFGLMYGMGPQRLAGELGVTLQEAEAILSRYFSRYPGVQEYQRRIIQLAETQGYVTTVLNRKRWIPGIRSQDPRERAQAERISINTPLQGSAADLMKLAMIALHSRLKEISPRSRLLLQVHDELLLEVPEEEGESLLPIIEKTLVEVYPLSVPLEVHLGWGKTWREAHGDPLPEHLSYAS